MLSKDVGLPSLSLRLRQGSVKAQSTLSTTVDKLRNKLVVDSRSHLKRSKHPLILKRASNCSASRCWFFLLRAAVLYMYPANTQPANADRRSIAFRSPWLHPLRSNVAGLFREWFLTLSQTHLHKPQPVMGAAQHRSADLMVLHPPLHPVAVLNHPECAGIHMFQYRVVVISRAHCSVSTCLFQEPDLATRLLFYS